jgi:hypothetical protein
MATWQIRDILTQVNRVFVFAKLLMCFLAGPISAQQLEIHFLHVSQGDAAIIQEGGHTAVIELMERFIPL